MLFEFTDEKGVVRTLPEWDVLTIALSAKQKVSGRQIGRIIEDWMRNPSKGMFFPEGRLLTRITN